jgi:hypothetical protein
MTEACPPYVPTAHRLPAALHWPSLAIFSRTGTLHLPTCSHVLVLQVQVEWPLKARIFNSIREVLFRLLFPLAFSGESLPI